MAEQNSSRAGLGGGIFLTLGVIAGYFGGVQYGEPVIGLLIGFTGGLFATLAAWLYLR